MAKKRGNPDITELGKDTRFRKGDPKPKEAQARGVKSRMEHKTMREILLAEWERDPSRKVAMVERMMARAEMGDPAAWDRVKELAREEDVAAEGQTGLVSLLVGAATASALSKIGGK